MKKSIRSLKKAVRRFGDMFGGRRASQRTRLMKSRRPQMEPLEQRQMLSIMVNSFYGDYDGDPNETSLHDAIDLANTTGEDIVFDPNVFDGLVGITFEDDCDPLVITNNYDIIGPADGLSINANSQGRVFYVTNGYEVTFSSMTLTGGEASYGGAIYADDNSHVTLSSMAIDSNQATGNYGGGIFGDAGSTLTINNSTTISNNTCGYAGGAIYTLGMLEVTDSIIDSNTAANSGGGIFANSTATVEVTNSSITHNIATSYYGGGIVNWAGELFIDNSTISGNTAGGIGGGIYDYENADTNIRNSVIAGNYADYAGGFYGSLNSQADLTNVTIAGNYATTSGGGVYNRSTLNIYNSIIAKNEAGTSYGDIYNSGSGDDYNNIIGTAQYDPGFIEDPEPDPNPANSVYGNLRLAPGSNAIDAGEDDYITGIAYDLDGNERKVDIDGNDDIVDIGAYEYQGEIVITTLDDDDSSLAGTNDPYNQYISLREALTIAKTWDSATPASDTITFHEDLEGTLTLQHGELEVDSDVIIEGPGADKLTIDADGLSRVFNVGSGVEATFSGVVITGGLVTGQGAAIYGSGSAISVDNMIISGNESTSHGGGIYVQSNSALTVTNSLLDDNETTGGYGGAIASYDSTIEINESTLSDNTADMIGGAIYIYNATTPTTPYAISNSTISGNVTTIGSGGGIYNNNSNLEIQATTFAGNHSLGDSGGGIYAKSSSSTSVKNSVFVGNSSSYVGGAIGGKENATFEIVNSTIAGNSTGSYGGGIRNTSGDEAVKIQNSIITQNTAANDPNISTGTLTADSGYYLIGGDSVFITDPDPGLNGWDGVDDDYGNLRLKKGITGAIDAGSNAAATGIDYDLDGNPRIADDAYDIVDIGAYEYQGEIVVTTLDDDDSSLAGTNDPYNQYVSLREALAIAKEWDSATPASDTITFHEDLEGTITLEHGQLVVDSDVTVVGPGADKLTIDADEQSRVFYVASGVEATFSGMTITGGDSATETSDYGGAIYAISDGIVTVQNSIISGNDAGRGGGIYLGSGSTVTIDQSTLSDNTAEFHGGGIYGYGSTGITINNNSVLSNNVVSGYGGAVCAAGDLSISDSVIDSNTATYHGGGIYGGGSSVFEIHNSIFSDNTSTSGFGGAIASFEGLVTVEGSSTFSDNQANIGGALYFRHDSVPAIASTITGATITGNQATDSYGGGIYNQGNVIEVSGTIVSGNKAVGSGGGIFTSGSGTTTVTNSSVANNTSGNRGGGIYGGTSDTLNLTNVTVAGNYATNYGGGIYYLGTLSSANSIIALNEKGELRVLDDIDGTIPSSGDNWIGWTNDVEINGDPEFISNPDPVDGTWGNGNDTYGNLRLRPGSDAIDAGNNTAATGIDYDLDGNPRIADDAYDIVDIGAYEYQGEIVVTTLDDDDSSLAGTNDPYNQYVSLREALRYAHDFDWDGDDTITFHPDLFLDGTTPVSRTITLEHGQLVVDSDVTIVGPGTDKLIIDAGGLSRVFCIDDADDVGDNALVSLSGMTITGGYMTGSDAVDAGGGIYNAESLTLTDMVITDNDAENGGGVMSDEDSALWISNSTISDNTAYDGGGGGITAIYTSAFTISDSTTISSNAAGYGGGIYSGVNPLVINDSTISENQSEGSTGGILAILGSLSVIRSSIFNNTAARMGGGITAFGVSSLYLDGTSITGNQATTNNGGGLYSENNTSVEITDTDTTDAFVSNISNNSADILSSSVYGYGGGIYNYGTGSFSISHTTVSGNTSDESGGGIYSTSDATLSISGSTIVHNTSGDEGGGIYTESSNTTTITNSVLAYNTATTNGGGIYGATDTGIELTNVTIAGNYADTSGGGVYYDDINGSLTAANTIISLNEKGTGSGDNICGTVPTTGNNLIDVLDPGFAENPSSNNDGDLHLNCDSLAINAGNNSDALGISHDLDGNDRVIYEHVDIGAFEYEGAILVSTDVDGADNDDYTYGDLSFREALLLAYGHDGSDVITFDSSLENEDIVLNQGQLEVTSNVTIEGLGDELLTIDANSSSRVFQVNSGVTATLSGMTITGGYVSGGVHGGGIYNAGTLYLDNMVVLENESDSSGSDGGGIYNYTGSAVTVTGSYFLGNQARNGGGIYGSTVTVVNSAFAGNIAVSYGGGIYGASNADIDLTNATIAGNYADTSGGGIYYDNTNGSLTAANSIISLNEKGTGSDDNIFGTSPIAGNNLIDVSDPGFVENPDDGGDGGWIDDPWTFFIDEGENNYGNLRLRPDCEAAINAGNNLAASGITHDLDGQLRIADDDFDIVDIGAYEYHGKIVVTTLDDDPLNDPSDLYVSLPEALDIAYQREGANLIGFDASLGSYIVINGSQIDIDSDVIFKSPAAGLSIASDISIAENVLLSFYTPDSNSSAEVSGNISGLGGLEKLGSDGMLSISGTNTYSGGTTIEAGVLQADATGALPGYDTDNEVVVYDGGTLAVNAGQAGEWIEDDIEDILHNVIFYSGSALGIDTSNASGSFSYTKPISVEDIFGLTKFGDNTLILSGNNTYSGTTTIVDGTLQIGDNSTSGTLGSGDVHIEDEDAILKFLRSDEITVNNIISGEGELHQVGAGKLILTAENSYTGVTRISDYQTLQIGDGTTDRFVASNIVTGDASTLIFLNWYSNLTYDGVISGEGILKIIGAETLTLTGDSDLDNMIVYNDGNLVLGDGGTTGSLGIEDDPNSIIYNDGTLSFNRSDSVTISANIVEDVGYGDICQSGTGTLIVDSNCDWEQRYLLVSSGSTLRIEGDVTIAENLYNYGTLDIVGSVEVLDDGIGAFRDVTNHGTITVTGSLSSYGDLNYGTIIVVEDGVCTSGERSIKGSASSVAGAGVLLSWRGLLESAEQRYYTYQVSTNGVDYTTIIDTDETPRSSFMLTGLQPDTDYTLRIIENYKKGGLEPDYSKKIYDGGTIRTGNVSASTGLYRISSINELDEYGDETDELLSTRSTYRHTVESTVIPTTISEDMGLTAASIVRFIDTALVEDPENPGEYFFPSEGDYHFNDTWVYASSPLEAVMQSFRGVSDGVMPTIDAATGTFKIYHYTRDVEPYEDFYSFESGYPEHGGLSALTKTSYTGHISSYLPAGTADQCTTGLKGPNGLDPNCGMPSVSSDTAIITMPAIDSTGGATACGGSCSAFPGLTYNSLDRNLDTGFGPGWGDVDEVPTLIIGQNAILARFGTENNIWFDKLADGTYQARYNAQQTLAHNSSYAKFYLTQPDGTVYEFWDDGQIHSKPGSIDVCWMSNGDTISYGYNAADLVSSVTHSKPGTSKEQKRWFVYEMGDDEKYHVQTIRLLQYDRITEETVFIRKITYDYYEDNEDYGLPGDLKTIYTQEWDTATEDWSLTGDTNYFRYHAVHDPDNGAVEHGLKRVLLAEAYAKFVNDYGDPADPLNVNAGDTQSDPIAGYTCFYYEYDADARVTERVVFGTSSTTTHENTFSENACNYNYWHRKSVAEQLDGVTETVYTNFLGQVILSDLNASGVRTLKYNRYDDAGRLVLTVDTAGFDSASGYYSDTLPDLVGYDSGDSSYLKNTDGEFKLFSYYDTSGSGAAEGYMYQEAVAEGETASRLTFGATGGPIVLASYEYDSRTVGSNTIYVVDKMTTYNDGNETGFIGHWALDDQSGETASDASENNLDGTLINSPAWTDGHFNGALSLNGTNSYVSVPASGDSPLKFNGGELTLSTWIYVNSTETTGGYLISKAWNGSGEYNYRLKLDSTKTVSFILQSSQNTISSPTALSTDCWHNIVATVDASNLMTLYVDGVSVASDYHTIADWTPTYGDLNKPLAIGTLYPYGTGSWSHLSYSLDGKIDDVQIYNRALSVDEVAETWQYVAGAATTSYDYTWYSDSFQAQQITTTLPVVSAAQNGSGTSNTTKQWYDSNGNLTWSMDELGRVTYAAYDPDTGHLAQTIEDIDAATVTSLSLTSPTGWTLPASGGINAITDYETDAFGRVTKTLGPEHMADISGTVTNVRTATWIFYDDTNHETRSAQGYVDVTTSDEVIVGPVSITITDRDGRTTEQIQATYTGYVDVEDLATATIAKSDYTAWTVYKYSKTRLVGMAVYDNIYTGSSDPDADDFLGTSGTDYELTEYGYENYGIATQMGRQNRVETPDGTITRYVFDALGNVVETWVGTNDTGATDSLPCPAVPGDNNMVKVTSNDYDADGYLLSTTQYPGGTAANLTTSYYYDWRGRLENVMSPADVVTHYKYDNLGRVTDTLIYASDDLTLDASELRAKTENLYDDLGRVYETRVYEVDQADGTVDPNDGTVGDYLASQAWYDERGSVIKTSTANGLFQKYAYDGLGRNVGSYTCYDTNTESYADADDVTGDTVIEQSKTWYNDASETVAVAIYERLPGDTSTVGELTAANSYATASAAWYDGLGRVTATANYGREDVDSGLTHNFFHGTSGTDAGGSYSAGDLFDVDRNDIPDVAEDNRPETLAEDANSMAGIDFQLQLTEYNNAGRAYHSIDNLGRINETQFDDMGRTVKTIQNYDNGTVEQTDTEQDITVEYEYDSGGRMVTMTAYNAKGLGNGVDAQATKYLYESDINASWQTAAVYPDSTDVLSQNATSKTWSITTDNGDHVSTDYDQLGRTVETTDQRGVVHEYTYDSAGRFAADTVTSLGSSGIVDGTVLRVGTTYDDMGRVQTITNYSDTDGNSPVNQIEYKYNGWGQVSQEYQGHDGVVDANTPFVQYDYDDGASGGVAKYVRLDKMTYPDDREVNYDYGTTGAIDDIMSRLSSIKDDDGSTVLASYKYLGAGTVVEENYEVPDIRLDYNDDGNLGGFDRFGRVIDHIWEDYSENEIDEFRYGYDLAGNRAWKENVVAGELGTPVHLDELYAYDAIDQLQGMQRGNLIDGLDGKEIDGTPGFTQDWELDGLGNWASFDDDGTTQTRTVDDANQITSISGTAVTPTYDAAGNMISGPKPGDAATRLHYKYDAWNRLVKVYDDNGTTLVAEYQYDGSGRRVVKGVDDDADGSLDTFTHFFHKDNQVIETREGDDVSGAAPAAESLQPKHQFIWSPRYIDSLILRDECDAQGDIITANRLFYLADANYNVTALVDTSGDVVERYLYTPYGETTVLDADFSTDADGKSDYDNTTLYTGREFDAETGLQYYRARYYHSELGRFVSRDPIGYDAGDVNLYEYVYSAPLGNLDPTGLFSPIEQRWLEDNLSSDVSFFEVMWNKIRWGNSTGRPSPKPLPKGPPTYNPDFWNDDGYVYSGLIQHSNNCYSYALNRPYTPTGAFRMQEGLPRPPEMGMYPNCKKLNAGAKIDGAIESPCVNGKCPQGTHKIQAAIDDSSVHGDWHWYRQDANGKWSHKPGFTEVTNLDASGKPITDPATADRNYGTYRNYSTLCKPLCAPD